MAYARFIDSDIYIYSHISGYIYCQACWLDESPESYFFKSVKLHTDQEIIDHLAKHREQGHDIPDDLEQEILSDPERFSKFRSE